VDCFDGVRWPLLASSAWSFQLIETRPKSAWTRALVCCFTLCGFGCQASAGHTAPDGNQATGGGTGSAGTSGVGGAAVLPQDAPPAFAPVRRLTHIEYDNTVADLLGDQSAPASKFTADVAQDGFTNNATALNVSPALAEQYLAAADALSKAATANLSGLLGCDPATGEQACVQQFIRDFGKRAWRRPLTTEEQTRLFAVFTSARADNSALDVSVQMVVQVLLQAPQFIYLLEPSSVAAGSVVPLDSWQVATRLSYFLLGSLPDAALFAEAERGALTTSEQVAAQARRLLQSPRARDRIGLFFEEWMQLRNVDRMQKDPTLFPNYTLELGPLLQQQVRLFATSVILDQGGTAADLLTAPYTFMIPELAPLYGVPPGQPGTFARVDLDPTKRAGLLTHVGIMASLAKANQTDPVHRGKFVRERLLCQTVPPPPVNANIKPPVVTPGSTTRQRFTQHRSDPACAGCHTLMDPIGLGFEHYDALGQWRDTDQNLPIDASGDVTASDVTGPFNGAIELTQKLAQSQEVKDCLVQTWFRFAHGRSVTPADAGNLAVLNAAFAGNGYKLSELMVAVTQTHAFRYSLVPDKAVSAGAGMGAP
jgi:Protein of unknown function (DUF1592)/Protein of unknown function (DUF1588)/Protein of unknown function (DUF1587)/Protein of unknown function (DUF1595)/Protein of unknown function (DUF1585)